MPSRLLMSAALWLLAGPSVAVANDRPVTEDERDKLEAAMEAEGCSGGTMQFDDGQFEVDDATCDDKRRYDLKFDTSFKLVDKDPDDD